MGRPARDLAAADLNGDGRLDLATANGSFDLASGDVSVLIGNGDGTFKTLQRFAAGVYTFAIAAGDLNRVGRLDLATANGKSDDISVLLGNGDGTFKAQQRFATGGLYPSAIAAADLDGNGALDLATANSNSNDVSVLLGNGDGTVKGQLHFAPGAHPRALATADLDGDGRLDLATANLNSKDVSVLLGNGDGTFKAQRRFATGWFPSAVAAADLDGDGRLDLATTNSNNPNSLGDVSVLLGNGNGTFQTEQRFAARTSPGAIAASDFNRDGRLDLVIANYDYPDGFPDINGSISVFLNLLSCGRPLPADGNQDGLLDISDGIHLLSFLFLGTVKLLPCGDGSMADPANLALLDANGDGALDLGDAIRVFSFLFQGAAPPVLGMECVPIPGCLKDVDACGE